MTRKLSTPFAVNSTLINQVPVSQTSDSQASYDIGFPVKNFQPIANGGVAVDGKDFNGILNDITGNIVDLNKGLPQYFDSAYSALIGGYPIGARLCLNDNSGYVVSTIDNNTNDPNTSRIGWSDTRVKEYDFKTAQPIQYYYDKLGNWDDAIFQAQVNVYKLGYSTKLVLPHGVIEVTRPILFNDALYYRIDKLYPELGVYDKVRNKFGNSIDDNYFTTSWCLTGAGKSSQPAEGFNQNGNSGSIGGLTSIKFVGGSPISNSSTDKQYMNYGIIHCAPDFIDGRKPRDYYDKDYPSLSGFNAVEISNLNIEGNTRCIHGIVIFGGHFHKLSNITIHDCYGAGIFLNWCFDMNVNDVTFIHCGRMSPNFNDYIADNKFGVEYQTYAPMQITCSGVRYDNSNYIRLDRCHFENNFRVCADVIVGGNSTPIWITNAHHESGKPIISDQDTKRVCYVPSKYGVAYFGQDSESDFDYKNISYNVSGGIIISRDCYGYSTNFSHVAIIDQYGQLDISGFNLSANVKLSANNANALYRAKNCVINDLEVNGGFSNDLPLDLEDVRIHGNVTTNYLNNFRFERVVIDGNTAFNYTDLSYNNPRKSMDFVSFGGSVNGDIRGGVLTNLKFNTANYNLINSGGITAEASNITNLEDYLKS